VGRKHLVTHSRSLTGVSGDAGSATQSFTYDGANRVIAASGLTDSAAYLYDHDSNRVAAAIGSVSTGYVYDPPGSWSAASTAPACARCRATSTHRADAQRCPSSGAPREAPAASVRDVRS